MYIRFKPKPKHRNGRLVAHWVLPKPKHRNCRLVAHWVLKKVGTQICKHLARMMHLMCANCASVT